MPVTNVEFQRRALMRDASRLLVHEINVLVRASFDRKPLDTTAYENALNTFNSLLKQQDAKQNIRNS